MQIIEFFFEFASTYSYLSAMRIESLLQNKEVQILWRPFLLGPIFKEQGWNDSSLFFEFLDRVQQIFFETGRRPKKRRKRKDQNPSPLIQR
nr:DsbA family protein [Leptospira yasudae]